MNRNCKECNDPTCASNKGMGEVTSSQIKRSEAKKIYAEILDLESRRRELEREIARKKARFIALEQLCNTY